MKSPMVSFRCTPIDLAALRAFVKQTNRERRKAKMRPISVSGILVYAVRKVTSMDPTHFKFHPEPTNPAPAEKSAKKVGSRRSGQTSSQSRSRSERAG